MNGKFLEYLCLVRCRKGVEEQRDPKPQVNQNITLNSFEERYHAAKLNLIKNTKAADFFLSVSIYGPYQQYEVLLKAQSLANSGP